MTGPDPTHCYICERIALRPETLTLSELATLTQGALVVRDMHVARVSDAEYCRRRGIASAPAAYPSSTETSDG